MTAARPRLVRLAPMLVAPALALLIAVVVTSVVLLVAGDPVMVVWQTILSRPAPRNIVNIINGASVLYLSGLAAAVCFRMKLFNIGVDGQYRVAAFAGAWVAGEAWLPGYLNTVLALLAAMLVGAMWAGIAGMLRVTRGVSEVISTIMLNAIATIVVAYLLRQVAVEGSNTISTTPIPGSSWVPGIPFAGAPNQIFGLAIVSLAVGVVYGVMLSRSRFGFELRATGASPTAAAASGISAKRIVLTAMLISGAIAGLVGMPLLFGDSHAYGLTFQSGLGFAGIAVALLGRNHPVGVGLGALLFAYLDEQSNKLQIFADVSPELVLIIQGVIVLSVVIAYEVVQRYVVRQEEKRVGAVLAEQEPEGREPAEVRE